MTNPISHLDLGSARITRIEEMPGPAFRLSTLFPDWDESIFDSHKDWLVPYYVNPEKMTALLNMHSWILQYDGRTILVDTCIGNDKDRMPAEKWHQVQSPYLERLAQAGFEPEDIDMVMCTHLHVDHVGWNTMLVDGKWVPTFPKARYLIGQVEFAHWQADTDEDQVAVMADSVLPVFDADLVDLVESNHKISDEISLIPTVGHTPGHVSVMIKSNGEEAMITGDFIHHPCQFAHPEWSSSFDTDPVQSAQTRREIFDKYADTPTLIIGTHFATPTAGHLKRDGDAYRLDV